MINLGQHMVTVGELLDFLRGVPPSAAILGCYDGVVCDVDVYLAKDGSVIIDTDGNYKNDFIDGSLGEKDRQ